MSLFPHRRLKRVVVAVGLLTASCATGSSAVPTAAPAATPLAPQDDEPAQTPASAEPEADASMEIPTACAARSASNSGDDAICTPPKKFVKRICGKSSPAVALTLFAKSSPWTRAYVGRDMEAWYVSPEAKRSSPKQLRRFEEVIILSNRSVRPGSVQVSGAGSYDVYRWDGTCVSVMSDEVSLRPPGTPDVATIPWKKLDDGIKVRLVQNRKIEYRNDQRLELCKKHGERAMLRCERAKSGLSRMIAEYVRGGGELPLITSVP